MKDSLFTVFSITNGRSTHGPSILSVQRSFGADRFPLVIVRDMGWVEALNRCLGECMTPYFVRLDDDFILHPRALEFMERRVEVLHSKALGFYYCQVWDVARKAIRKGLKIYATRALRRIGGFKADQHTGRVDRVTNPALMKAGFTYRGDHSIVAIHACGTMEEQERYAGLWGRHAALEDLEEVPSLKAQARLSGTFLESVNEEKHTSFHTYLGKVKS